MSMHVRLGCEVKCEASASENFEFSNRPPTMNLFRIAGNPWILYYFLSLIIVFQRNTFDSLYNKWWC